MGEYMTKQTAQGLLSLYSFWACNYKLTVEQAAIVKGGKTSDQYAEILAAAEGD